ncbi:MAG: hypothetical protein ACOY4Q_13470 [Bacillota bacterium]
MKRVLMFILTALLISGCAAGKPDTSLNPTVPVPDESDKNLPARGSDIRILIEQKLEAILHEPSASSNPYTLLKNSSEFAEIMQMGRPALEYLLDKFENTTSDGLEEYVMAIPVLRF